MKRYPVNEKYSTDDSTTGDQNFQENDFILRKKSNNFICRNFMPKWRLRL